MKKKKTIMAFGLPDTGKTISLKYKPGQDARIATTKSQSIFTFGDYRLERGFDNDTVSGDTKPLQFDSFGTLDNLGATNFETSISYFVKPNELNLEKKEPTNYQYFASFYIEIANSINAVIEDFPYAVLCTSTSGGNTIFDYSEENNLISLNVVSKFKIRISDFINQGNVRINSGDTSGDISVLQNYDQFAIQLRSGSSSYHEINTCVFSSDTVNGNYLYLEVIDSMLGLGTTSSSQDVYIRPTKERYSDFKNALNPLEQQVFLSGTFYIPDVELDDDTVLEETYIWPKAIDGFNPDSSGDSFDTFKTDILKASQNVDDAKTNIFLKSIIPETYLEADSDRQIFRTMIQTYAQQFDQLKRYVDGMAYAYTVNYNEKESVPNKFIYKLSDLLGWEMSDAFNEQDLFSYLVSEQETDETSFSYFNLEIWKRILNNITWLYKRKGTRDAIMFIFNLIGAPECLINLNEFVYDIQRYVAVQQPVQNPTIAQSFQAFGLGQSLIVSRPTSVATSPAVIDTYSGSSSSFSPTITLTPSAGGTPTGSISSFTTGSTPSPSKINAHGYINYDVSKFIFQEGGEGRGNGQDYINQWRPEFDLLKRQDNIKVQTGDSTHYGTEHIVNTKEIEINFDASKAVECDVKQFYEQSCSCWNWGSACPPFSALTVPFYYTISDCSTVQPTNISTMTLTEYLKYVFTNSINPRTRKVSGLPHTSSHYAELKKVYMNYYYSTTPTNSHLTVGSMEAYMELLEVNLHTYMLQLLPATTIFGTQGTVYRNPLFHRQKFVYKEGINNGSEFQVRLPIQLTSVQTPVNLTPQLPTIYDNNIEIINIYGSVSQGINVNLSVVQTISNVNKNKMEAIVPSVGVSAIVRASNSTITRGFEASRRY